MTKKCAKRVSPNYTKLVYLENHPELNPKDVDLEKIGGLLDFMEGPSISIKSDGAGNQKADFKFKNLNLVA